MTTRLLALAVGLLLWPLAVQAQPIVEYYHLDGVGDVIAVTDSTGAVVEQHDYLPFGEEWCGTGVCGAVTAGQPKRFTGKERDTETGLDYFGARYYASKIGRFTTTDPVLDAKGALFNPQKWNRYAYGLNNPLRYVDPDGRAEEPYVYQQMWRDEQRRLGGPSQLTPQQQQADSRIAAAILAPLAVLAAPAVAEAGGALALEARIALGLLGPRVGQMIAGPYGEVSRGELEKAASAGGPTISVLTRQTSAPEAGRALSAAAGEGAQALANAARAGGTLYTGAIPRGLMSTMEKAGLVQARTTMMQGAQATEYRFMPQATEFVARFFDKKQ